MFVLYCARASPALCPEALPTLTRMIRPLGLLVALLFLAACDASGPSDSDDILGTWTLSSVTSQQTAMSSVAQTVVDLTRAPAGEVQLSEGENGSLAFLGGYYRYDQSSSLYLSSFDPSVGDYPAFRQYLEIREDAGSSFASLTSEGETDAGYVYNYYTAGGTGGMRSGATYTIDTRLDAVYGSGQPRAKGTFTLGNWTIPANTPTVVSTYSYEFPDGNTGRYTFERGGVLKVQEVFGNQVTTRTGSWSRNGDRVTLSIAEDGVTVALEYKAVRDGSTLDLIVDQEAYPCDAECLRYSEDQFGMDRGTLRSLKTSEIIRLSSAPAAQSKRGTASAVGLPASLAARVRVAPMPEAR